MSEKADAKFGKQQGWKAPRRARARPGRQGRSAGRGRQGRQGQTAKIDFRVSTAPYRYRPRQLF